MKTQRLNKMIYIFSFALALALFLVMFATASSTVAKEAKSSSGPDWAFNTTVIEACSCPMLCQCYFNTQPAAHHDHGEVKRFCRFNNAFKVNKGYYGDVKLDGAKFWVAGDLGPDFSKHIMDWAVLIFDPSVTNNQREAIRIIVINHLLAAKWKSFTVAKDAQVEWRATKDRAEAKLDDGKVAEIVLNRFQGHTDDPVIIKNIKWWGEARNEGFILMPNEIEAYRAGDKTFEYKGTSGFMVTLELTSKDLK